MPVCVFDNNLHKHRFASSQRALHITHKQQGKRLIGLPLGMFRRQHLDAIEREQKLKIHRLLGP
jgi:hypothetical protein